MMRLILGTFAAAGLCVAAQAAAQGQTMTVTPVVQIAPGMQVTDTSGAPVGTVKAIQGTNLVIQTDKHQALLPRASFSISKGKLLFGMTQAQLDAQIEKSLSASNAAIVAGATVKGTGGTPVGTIDSVADGKVTMTLQNGKKIAVPQQGFRGNADGTVTIGYSAAQLEALVQGGGSTGESATSASPGSASK